MGYSIIPLVVSIVLSFIYVCATDVSIFSKMAVSTVLCLSLVCRFWWPQFSLLALFLQVGLSIFVLLCQLVRQARS